jgi:hypothetical protein
MNPKAQAIKANIDKWDHTKVKGFCTTKEIINSEETTYGMGEYICKSYIREGVNTKIYKE